MSKVFGIYQTYDAPWKFFGWDFACEHGFTMDVYDRIYDLELADDATLDDVYYILNMRHPEDYPGHSLSMGDVVEVGNIFYYVDDVGFVDIGY